jgi:alkylated DNA repair dioxygenase AlkB
VQYYRDGSDYISEHTDKTLDIKFDTSILNFSLGATRKMQLKSKKKDFKTNERKK